MRYADAFRIGSAASSPRLAALAAYIRSHLQRISDEIAPMLPSRVCLAWKGTVLEAIDCRGRARALAQLSLSPTETGLPVLLTWPDHSHSVGDLADLQLALCRFLSDPAVARMILFSAGFTGAYPSEEEQRQADEGIEQPGMLAVRVRKE